MMNRYLFVLLGFSTLVFADLPRSIAKAKERQDPEVAVQERDLPKLPTQKRPVNRILIERCKALVLVGPDHSLLNTFQQANAKGLMTVGLKLPGPKSRLERNLNPLYLNKQVTSGTIQQIKDEINEFYRKYNHPFILIEVPEQNVSNGVLQLVILETRAGKITVQGTRFTNEQTIKDYLEVQPNAQINEQYMIDDINFLNQNPFRQTDVLYSPGTQPGTTDIALNLHEKNPLRIYAGTDNTGVDTTGRQRLYAGLNYANMFNLGHVFSYQYTSSYDFHRFQAHTAQYLAPLSWKHVLNIYGGYSTVNSDLPSPSMRSSGFNTQISGRYNVPFNGSRFLRHEAVYGLDWKRLNNTVEFVDANQNPAFGKLVNITQLVLGYIGAYERTDFRIDYEAELFWSPGQVVSDQSNDSFDSLRPGATNHWVYGRGSFVYLQTLPDNYSFSFTAVGQLSSNPLLPTEQYALGGYNTVRGYEEHAYNADGAFLGSVELRTRPCRVLWRYKKKYVDALQLLAFVDYGYGNNKIAIDPLPKSAYLLGIGPGVRYVIDPWLSARLDYGIKLHKTDFFGGGNSMWHFGVTLSY